MDTVLSLLVLSALSQLVVPEVPRITFRATVEIVSGTSRIFSGENLQLRCSIPEDYNATWTFQWFRASELLPQYGEIFKLWNANVKESGKFSCQGIWDTITVGHMKTQRSLPVEINVDGGWAILDVPSEPGLVGDTLKLTCRLRHNFPVHESILYRDGIEIMRQKGRNLHLVLANVSLEDNGMYSCRVSFDMNLRTHSVISVAAPVQVLEVLSQPVLEIDTESIFIEGDKMKLICHVQYNARAPAPPLHYYFYRNNNRLGTATSENHDIIRRTPGQYSCKAKVPVLGVSRWSEAKSFGEVTGDLK
ncbi:high affinity immunoglobulin gamma Fc receptor I-like [Cololabis saira]|uniref:high affinity immunoglobulin gamma Fc receptor I-like n=1 Tax=Cololabis saira TaxID=129043 RepID=UPI002AD32A7B|nr:high affinity immunoglobulin gamma Fc receptor I-like [Cololabis saira]